MHVVILNGQTEVFDSVCSQFAAREVNLSVIDLQSNPTDSKEHAWHLERVDDLEIKKGDMWVTGDGRLHLQWTPSSDPFVNAYRIMEGTFGSSFIKTGYHPCPSDAPDEPPYEQAPYNHQRSVCSVTDPVVELDLPADRRYYTVVPTCNEILMPDKNADDFFCYYLDPDDPTGTIVFPFISNYVSEGPTGFDSQGRERLSGVCSCPGDPGTCTPDQFFPQPGDPGR